MLAYENSHRMQKANITAHINDLCRTKIYKNGWDFTQEDFDEIITKTYEGCKVLHYINKQIEHQEGSTACEELKSFLYHKLYEFKNKFEFQHSTVPQIEYCRYLCAITGEEFKLHRKNKDMHIFIEQLLEKVEQLKVEEEVGEVI